MLFAQRTKYADIQEKTKKKKLENDLLARDIKRLEEQLSKKKAQTSKNNTLLQFWQKEVASIVRFTFGSHLAALSGHGHRSEYQTAGGALSPISYLQISPAGKSVLSSPVIPIDHLILDSGTRRQTTRDDRLRLQAHRQTIRREQCKIIRTSETLGQPFSFTFSEPMVTLHARLPVEFLSSTTVIPSLVGDHLEENIRGKLAH